ncbi:MAG: hypothetical protein R2836_07815 [Chitinophagales bacterium]
MVTWLVNKGLLIVVGLVTLAGAFGWIMVASGLNNDNRTWVVNTNLANTFNNSYKFIFWSVLYFIRLFFKIRNLKAEQI